MTPALLSRLQTARADTRPVVLATNLQTGAQLLLPDDPAPQDLSGPAAQALEADRNTTITVGNEPWFLHAYAPPLRLVVVGAVHIAQALVPMAIGLGWAVLITDPRRAFATDERFPSLQGGLTVIHRLARRSPRPLASRRPHRHRHPHPRPQARRPRPRPRPQVPRLLRRRPRLPQNPRRPPRPPPQPSATTTPPSPASRAPSA